MDVWNGFYIAELSVKICLYVNRFGVLQDCYNVIVEVVLGRVFGLFKD